MWCIMRSSVVSWATKLWVGERILGSVIFICITEGALNILCVFCSNLSRLSLFWSLWFIWMPSKDALWGSLHTFWHLASNLHSLNCTLEVSLTLQEAVLLVMWDAKEEWWEHLPISFWLEVEWCDIKLKDSKKGKWSFSHITNRMLLFYTSGACFRNIKLCNVQKLWRRLRDSVAISK